ncbi:MULTISPECIES: ABC transporter permease [Lysobacter]|uniref:ABC transporter permease n=1 Tax=Lysobacter TaxID=68 RepID=UPI001F2B2FA5|nr:MULTISPECIES: hypothetical protein [Lysobacter]UJB20392.1 hypothetical protein L1A79_04735 [Lysobacter capsici]UJQ30494.1 hypothetical protein L2D09_10125 [Lysobacter gummosus]
MSMLFNHFMQSVRKPDHWLYGSWLDTVVRYRKMRLGMLWLLIPTVVYIWVIGGFLVSMQPGIDKARFFAHIGIGYTIFRMVAAVMSDATSVFAGYQYFIYDGNQRLTDFILRNLARSFYYFLLTMPLVMAVAIASPDFDLAGIPLAVAGLAVVLVNLFSFSVVLSIAGARFPDLSELMGSIMMAAFLITPVVWYPQAAPEDTASGMFMRANPFHHLLLAIRAPLLGETIDASSWVYLPVMTATGLIAAAVTYRLYARRVAVWL